MRIRSLPVALAAVGVCVSLSGRAQTPPSANLGRHRVSRRSGVQSGRSHRQIIQQSPRSICRSAAVVQSMR